jgi:hypothetical protein
MISPFTLGHEYEYGTEFEVRGYSLRSSYLRLFFVSPPTKVSELEGGSTKFRRALGPFRQIIYTCYQTLGALHNGLKLRTAFPF